ncbi:MULTISPECIES: glycosyl hydrolase [unclassified Actinotalea]|uniref:glycosyl hydrolase n=1 Tax=unclassified Actinotalea TaxID=2638618 RepID=UPI0015F3DE2A|nr:MULTISPECIES: glycosyl hydrolase [unclassified Actinotalea]
MRRRTVAAAVVGVTLGVGAVTGVALGLARDPDAGPGEGGASTPSAPVPDSTLAAPPDDLDALVAAVGQSSPGDLGPMRLAPDLLPPTNRWFSGLVFGDQPQPVFALPVSFGLTDEGFALGAPVPVASPHAVVGPHVPAVEVSAGTSGARVSAYDAARVEIALLGDDGEPRATVTLAQGSPFVTVTALADVRLTTPVPFEGDEGALVATTEAGGTREWGLVTDGAWDDGVDLATGETATFYPLPDDADRSALETLAEAAADPLLRVDLTQGVAAGSARTTLTYRTADGVAGAVVAMPHHRTWAAQGEGDCGLGTYPSVYGTLELCAGGELTTVVPALTEAATLDLSDVDEATREALREQLAADVAATPPYPSDSYFGGKALHRSAVLVQLGRQLGADDVVAPLVERVTEGLREWADPDGCAEREARCVVYDPVARGVVGLTTNFGSEEFNDHHFHYGYLLAAAGIMAADDPDLAADLAPVMDLLAEDIAAGQDTEWFPRLRVFDAYRGHSWASGTVPFADGNNQESTSEAVAAWNGLALWGAAAGREDLVTQARWLLSVEAATARTYWTEPDLTDPALEGFEDAMFSLGWGAKRDHATWFSAEPNAILGIQLIPPSPVDGVLAADEERVRQTVGQATANGFDVQFGDLLLMYLALVDPDAARTAAQTLPAERIDDGNSRTYLEAWLAAPPARASG